MTRGSHASCNIAAVLEMTVSKAVEFFADDNEVIAMLQPLIEVGLDYLRLGQPVPTLSGGEAQRLKLAGRLAQEGAGSWALGSGQKEKSGLSNCGATLASAQSPAPGSPGTLFLFDEPTTGLHFDDIAKLLRSFRRLIDAGHSVLVIEHNLDVVGAADWIIDLGPEGGEAGGEIVCAGTPAEVMKYEQSHTGKALKEYQSRAAGLWALGSGQKPEPSLPGNGRQPETAREKPSASCLLPEPSTQSPAARIDARASIQIHGAREHNLKNINVELPRNKFTVVTGVSGSGKSTLAFDIVFGEGQRRYLESLNAYARQFVQPASRPDVDAIFGIPPTVAIEQRTSRGGRKSTVATLTEIYHFLRLLYVKLGVQYCPDCDVAIEPQSFEAIAARVLKDYRGRTISVLAPLVTARKGYYTDLAAWAAKKGYAHLRVDGELQPTNAWPRLSRFKEHTIELPVATLKVAANAEREIRAALTTALDFGKDVVHIVEDDRRRATGDGLQVRRRAAKRRPAAPSPQPPAMRIFSTRRACPSCARSFAELDPRLFSFNSKHGWCEACYGTGLRMRGFDAEQSGEEIWWNEWFEDEAATCASCDGQRLNAIALNVRFRTHSIARLTTLSVPRCAAFCAKLKLQGREIDIARDLLAEINSRLAFLEDVGLGYLSLDRSAPTLSGGEAQRIRLAAQLGSNLQGVCYILDEPTIGLHQRDNRILLDTLERLAAEGQFAARRRAR